MADVPLRLNPSRDIQAIKALRQNRQNSDGLYTNASTGLSSRNRRDVINKAVKLVPCNAAYIVRRRLRRGWTLSDALNTAQLCDSSAVLTDSLINYWKFEESSGTRFPTVGSLNMTEVSTTITAVAGKNGNSASFDDSEGFQTTSFALPLPYSIAVWVNLTYDGVNDLIIIRQSDGSNSRRLDISGVDGNNTFFGSLTGSKSVSPDPISSGVWSLMIFTVDASGVIKGSVNGQILVTGSTVISNPGAGLLQVGRAVTSPTPACAVDSLFIFNKALSQADVTQLWNGGAGYFP